MTEKYDETVVEKMFYVKNGLVRILAVDVIAPGGKPYFHAERTVDFVAFTPLNGTDSHDWRLQDVVDFVERSYQEAIELEDLGAYVLYCNGPTETNWRVSMRKRGEYQSMVAAAQVPVGAHLTPLAQSFFRLYKGQDAVRNDLLAL